MTHPNLDVLSTCRIGGGTMWRNIRRVDVAACWQHARRQYAAVVAERDALRRELLEIRRERDAVVDDLHELRIAVMERQQACYGLRVLYREREIARARAAERDPAAALN